MREIAVVGPRQYLGFIDEEQERLLLPIEALEDFPEVRRVLRAGLGELGLRRALRRTGDSGGRLDLPGGFAKSGENGADALRRESSANADIRASCGAERTSHRLV